MNTDSLSLLTTRAEGGQPWEDFQILQRLLHEESVALWVASDGLDTIRRQSFNSQEELGLPLSHTGHWWSSLKVTHSLPGDLLHPQWDRRSFNPQDLF